MHQFYITVHPFNNLMSKSTNKRYGNDKIDFIIPFLVNQSTESSTNKELSIKKKKYSVPTKIRQPLLNSSAEMVKIYRGETTEKIVDKSQRKAKLEKAKLQLQQKQYTKLQFNLNKSPYIARNRFFKAHSVLNYAPPPLFSQERSQFIRSPIKNQDDSPIPGVRFKKKLVFNQSAHLIPPQIIFQNNIVDAKSQTPKIKYRRQKKQWNKKRCANVDFIINRKCKNFNDLILEYRRRLNIDQAPKIFVFNSKDSWLKRVLLDRGWVENKSKESRAFHLYWSNKVYKEKVFPQQLVNHYKKSDLLTSKAGLHQMLVKYGLTYLQPKTYDLALQRTQFTNQYIKLSFLQKLTRVISKFEFEDQPLYKDIKSIRYQIAKLIQKRKKQQPQIQQSFSQYLLHAIEDCLNLSERLFDELTTNHLDHILSIINSQLILSPFQEQLVRIIRQVELLIRSSFARDIESGLQNIWLTKNKNSSKGVGISLHKDYESIVKHQNRLAQKYIENPLIFQDATLKGRKFDIRIWALLVGNTKPELYYHQKFYGRLCYQSYSLETISLDNQKKHLTNYSQNKLKFKDEHLSQSIIMPNQIFDLLLQERNIDYRDRFYAKVQNLMSKLSLIFKIDIAEGSQNSFELFGLDLLIDDNLNLHLLEVNLSAACQERHEGLTEMLEDIGHGMMNILYKDMDYKLQGWRLIK